MTYDTLRDVEFDNETIGTVDEIADEYGLADQDTPEHPSVQMQAELLEAINQFGSQTMDDTVKRNGMWALIHALTIVENQFDLNTTFTVPTERSHPQYPELLREISSDDRKAQSILARQE